MHEAFPVHHQFLVVILKIGAQFPEGSQQVLKGLHTEPFILAIPIASQSQPIHIGIVATSTSIAAEGTAGV